MARIYYSTVPYMKFYLQRNYFNDIHYVWASESFDNSQAGAHTPASLVAPSSNPVDVFKDLQIAVTKRDRHSYKINEQKLSLKKIAVDKCAAGEITPQQRDDVIFTVDSADFEMWRPIIYLIPNTIDPARVHTVPMAQRASLGPEFIIKDLTSSDFDIIDMRG